MSLMDKSAFLIVRSETDLATEKSYWLTKSFNERLEAIEFLRQNYIQMLKLSPKIDKTVYSIHKGK
jgi:hypothetical protein